MTSMSHDPAAAVIGAQLIEMSTTAVAASAAAAPSLTVLMPAGAEEVSMMASTSFAATAEAALAAHVAAQQELAKAGAALIDIARIYAQTDATAASALEANAMQTTLIEAAGFTSAPVGRLLRSEALPGAAGTAARTPLMANLVEGTATAAPAAAATSSTTLPTVASTMLGAATAPLSSISQLTSIGGAAGGPAAAVPASLTGDDEPIADDDGVGRPGQELA
jgi:PE family